MGNVFVITLETVKIQTYSLPQNDHLNLSFVKIFVYLAE